MLERILGTDLDIALCAENALFPTRDLVLSQMLAFAIPSSELARLVLAAFAKVHLGKRLYILDHGTSANSISGDASRADGAVKIVNVKIVAAPTVGVGHERRGTYIGSVRGVISIANHALPRGTVLKRFPEPIRCVSEQLQDGKTQGLSVAVATGVGGVFFFFTHDLDFLLVFLVIFSNFSSFENYGTGTKPVLVKRETETETERDKIGKRGDLLNWN